MTVHTRPTPLHPAIESWSDLEAYLARRERNFRVDFEDDETAQSIGLNKQWMSRGRVAVLLDIRSLIAPLVDAERVEAEQTAEADRIDATYKSTYGDGPDGRMAQWQAEDR